jgi:thioester reductase-like protein
MAYLVTGGTGFLGRFLVERLLERGEGDVHLLVRASSRPRLEALIERWGAAGRVHPVEGDLAERRLGVADAWVAEHAGAIDHVFHLAAVYDITAGEERNRVANVDGTRHAVELANALPAGRLHHVSSVAAAGDYEGVFTEDMFDEGQPLGHPYHATKFASEKIARTESEVPWRVYRPAIVVGHSRTGEMDKIDGPYYFFRVLRLASRLPSALPLLAPRLGDTNIVPVDFVVAAMDHIAHARGLDGQAFHLVSPEPQRTVDVLNTFARIAGAPRLQEALPAAVLPAALRVPGVRGEVLPRLGIPPEAMDHVGFTARFDASRAQAALAGTGIAVPPIESYAQTLWDYWARELEPKRNGGETVQTPSAAR